MARLDLDELLPDPHIIVLSGVEYEIPAEVPLPFVLEALRLQDKLLDSDTVEEKVSLLERMYDMVMRLFRQQNADVPDLALSPRQLGRIVGFAASSRPEQTSLELGVVEGLTGDDQPDDEERDAADKAAAEQGEAAPDAAPPTSQQTASPRRRQSRAKS